MNYVFRFLTAVTCALALVTTTASATNGAWRLVEMDGTVRTALPMGGIQSISTGHNLDAGAVVTTGIDGRAVLARGDQTIVVGPSSRMSLPAVEEPGMTRIFQDLGTLLFKVDKRDKQHFRVETPVIAAVVKGTTFTVSANSDSHAVHVAEGAVEVSSRNGASRQLATAGMTARVFKDNPSTIEMSTSAARNDGAREGGVDRTRTDGELILPTEIGADPLDFATLTDGLVQASQNSASTATQARFNRESSPTPGGGFGNSEFGSSIAELRRTGANNNAAARAIEVSNANAAPPSNSNAGGNGNGNPPSNSNAGGNGNGNPPSNSNAGGNGNGNPPSNSNAGGNGNGNPPSNSNAGGNGNGNPPSNSNAGGNVNASANAPDGPDIAGGKGGKAKK